MYQPHPLALSVPEMTEDEFAELKADIEANGLRVPIVLYEGKALDGRHRDRACRDLGLEVRTVDYTGDQPAEFVVSMNVRRRHLTPSQRAAVAADMKPHFAKEAEQRRAEGWKQRGADLLAEKPEGSGNARDHAAKAAGVSGSSVDKAVRVKQADPELFERVKRGEVSVTKAEAQIAPPKAPTPPPPTPTPPPPPAASSTPPLNKADREELQALEFAAAQENHTHRQDNAEMLIEHALISMKRHLREAWRLVRELELDDEETAFVVDDIASVRDSLVALSAFLQGGESVDWDAELAKLSKS